jgi:hypothetical protein
MEKMHKKNAYEALSWPQIVHLTAIPSAQGYGIQLPISLYLSGFVESLPPH